MGETLPPGMALFNKSLRVKNGPDQPNGGHDAVLSHEVFEAIAVTTWLADRLDDRRGPGTNGRPHGHAACGQSGRAPLRRSLN